MYGAIRQGNLPYYWGDYLEEGNYTYLFVNKDTYRMLGDGQLADYQEAAAAIDGLAQD